MMRSNEEWQSIFTEVSKAIESSHPTPAISVDSINATTLAGTIDHTLLKLDATSAGITELCKEASEYDFAVRVIPHSSESKLTISSKTVCVRVNFVAHAKSQLKDAKASKVCCVVGFHEGTQSTASKVSEAQSAIAAGAAELDMVLNRDLLKPGDYISVFEDLKAIRAVTPPGIVLKLILETSELNRDGIIAAGVLAGYAGCDFIKTSTGFCGRGASLEDVELMSKIADAVLERIDIKSEKKMKIKASGGVRGLEDAKKMIAAGAERIGTSSGVKIMKELLDGSVRLGNKGIANDY